MTLSIMCIVNSFFKYIDAYFVSTSLIFNEVR